MNVANAIFISTVQPNRL